MAAIRTSDSIQMSLFYVSTVSSGHCYRVITKLFVNNIKKITVTTNFGEATAHPVPSVPSYVYVYKD